MAPSGAGPFCSSRDGPIGGFYHVRTALPVAWQSGKRRQDFMASATLRDYLQYTEDAISAGRIDEAQARCQRILSHFPESLEAQRLLGEVYLAQEQLEEAQQTFDWI